MPSTLTFAGSPTIPVLVFHGTTPIPVGGAIKWFNSSTVDLELGATPNTTDQAGLDSVRYTVV
jgi:hypothetical protein